MNESICHERPNIRLPTSRPDDVSGHAGIVARRNESKQKQEFAPPPRSQRQKEKCVDEAEHDDQGADDNRHVEHSFATGLVKHVGH